MTENGLCQLRVFSFDFHQPAHSDQSRKTRFFRHLYGYTQRIKRRLKDGQVTTYSYHYPGILDQIPHIKLGKSVFGILPGTESLVLDLFQSYNEVIVHQFIGMIPIPIWLSTGSKKIYKTHNS